MNILWRNSQNQKMQKENRKEFHMVKDINYIHCDEHFLMFVIVKLLCCARDIKFCMSTIL